VRKASNLIRKFDVFLTIGAIFQLLPQITFSGIFYWYFTVAADVLVTNAGSTSAGMSIELILQCKHPSAAVLYNQVFVLNMSPHNPVIIICMCTQETLCH